MIRAGVDFAFAAHANDITRTVLVVAKERAAAVHALFLVRFGWIECWIGSARIRCDAPGSDQCLVIIGPVPITAPRCLSLHKDGGASRLSNGRSRSGTPRVYRRDNLAP